MKRGSRRWKKQPPKYLNKPTPPVWAGSGRPKGKGPGAKKEPLFAPGPLFYSRCIDTADSRRGIWMALPRTGVLPGPGSAAQLWARHAESTGKSALKTDETLHQKETGERRLN